LLFRHLYQGSNTRQLKQHNEKHSTATENFWYRRISRRRHKAFALPPRWPKPDCWRRVKSETDKLWWTEASGLRRLSILFSKLNDPFLQYQYKKYFGNHVRMPPVDPAAIYKYAYWLSHI
jgi:hypothetical protein